MPKKKRSVEEHLQELTASIRHNRVELEKVSELLQYLLAIELWRGGLSQENIGKRIRVAKETVNTMLKGVGREVTAITENAK